MLRPLRASNLERARNRGELCDYQGAYRLCHAVLSPQHLPWDWRTLPDIFWARGVTHQSSH